MMSTTTRRTASVVLLVLLFAACTSARAPLTTIEACVDAAQGAVSAFKMMKASGKIADADGQKELKVRAAYAKFQAMITLAIDVARDPRQTNTAIGLANAGLNDLLPVLEGFGVVTNEQHKP